MGVAALLFLTTTRSGVVFVSDVEIFKLREPLLPIKLQTVL